MSTEDAAIYAFSEILKIILKIILPFIILMVTGKGTGQELSLHIRLTKRMQQPQLLELTRQLSVQTLIPGLEKLQPAVLC